MKKIISVLLCVALIVSVAPIVSAQGYIDNTISSMDSENLAESITEPYIVGEIIEKRTENTKHFLMSDRSVMAAMYNETIHYEDNGSWVDIDNSFSSNNENEFENKSNSFKTKFSKKSNGNKLVTVTKDGYSLSWKLDNADKVDAEISQSDDTQSEDISVLKNIQGSVTYPDIQNDVDLQYVVSGTDIKENIILQSAGAPTEYSFTYKFNELKYRTNDSNQIEFYDESSPENIVFIIDTPYMYDSDKAYSNDIELQISETSNGFTLKVIPDKEWFLSEDRVYPIVIDPSILSSQSADDVWDIEIRNTQTSALSYTAADFLVGSDTSGQIYRSLIKFPTLPNIDEGGIVVNAKMYVSAYKFPYYDVDPSLRTRPTDDIQVNVHRIKYLWPEEGATWLGYADSYDSVVEDYFIYNDTDEIFSADITKLVNSWYKGNNFNYGIMLKAANESAANHVMQFTSSDWGVDDTNSATWRPCLTINYRICTGLEDYWSYTTQSMGGYGTGYINNYNGSFTYIHSDTSFNSIINGFTLSHVYNSANSQSSTGRYGIGWRLNLTQTFEPTTIKGNTKVKFVYTDGDGTKHYFVELDNGNIVDEDGLGYTYTDITTSGSELTSQLTDKDENVLKFDKWGALRRIIDPNGNTINLNYSPVPNQFNYLSSITTSSGGSFVLNYDSNYMLTSITDNAGRVTKYEYTSGNLMKITYPDGSDLDFTYFLEGNEIHGYSSWLNAITLPNGYGYFYENDSAGKFDISYEISANGNATNQLYYTYEHNQTKIEDSHERYIVYQFDSFGRVTCVYDSDGNSYSETYTQNSDVPNKIFSNNKLNLASSNVRYINNLIANPVFSDGLTGWSTYSGGDSATREVVTGHSLLSSNSILVSTSNQIHSTIYQIVNTSGAKIYTLSAYMKLIGVESASFGAGLEIVTSNGRYLHSEFKTGTTNESIDNGFEKFTLTVELQDGEYIHNIGAGLFNAKGFVYIDSVQLEEGDTANKINLISNSSFEKNSGLNTLPTGFTGYSGANVGGANNSVTFEDGGSYTVAFVGNPTAFRSARQAINISGKAGDVFSYGGWAKAYSIPAHTSGNVANFQMCVKAYYTDGTTEWFSSKFDINVSEWQYTQAVLPLKKDYTKLELSFGYDYNCNTAYFDNIFLYRDTAQSYTYDENGNVVSTADYAKQQSTFEYTNNNLSKTIEPVGTKYEYKYDSKNNLVNAWSNVGIDYNVAYDSYGNATNTTIVPNDTTQLISGRTYYIKNKESGQYLTIDGSCTTNKTIKQQPLSDSPLQRWVIQKLSNGNYIIVPENCTSHILTFRYSTIKGDVVLGARNSSTERTAWCQWNILSSNGKGCVIKSTYSSCSTPCVAVGSSDRTVGGRVYMETAINSDNKNWILVPAFNAAITSSATYQNNGNFPHTVTDSRGNTTTYTYDTARGLQTGVTDASGNSTTYNYNSLNDRLDSVSSGGSNVLYHYDSVGRLTGVEAPSGTRYALIYDEYGYTTDIYMEQQVLIENEYDVWRGLLTHSTYGNGHEIGYVYDNLDRVIQKLYNGITKVKFRYDKFGNLYEKQDLFTNTTYHYNYDLTGRIVGVTGSNGTSLNYVYDDFNRTKKYIAKFDGNSNVTEYIYGDSSVSGQKNGLLYGVKQNDVERISYTYDKLARLNKRTLNTTTPFVTNYYYHQGATSGTATTLIKKVQNGSDSYEYAYDAVGNITQIKKNGSVYETYTYDNLNQLKTVTRGSDTYTYNYDNGGNIQSVTLNGSTIKNYTYGDIQWFDLLTAYNGQTITYDQIGNPLQYRDGFNFAWSNGRQLTGITNGTDNISYLYNADGLRASKTVNGITTDYYWLEGVLLGQKTGNDYIIYLYDENGAAYGIICNNTYYYYVFNAQGDVVGIIDSTGTQVVSYDYSAWGEVLSITGTMADTLGQQNPIRYRGYYYDNETGFYYLQSRYYDPVTQRFLNADGLISTGQGMLGNNMFAYCGNNPVNYKDPSGQSFCIAYFIEAIKIGFKLAVAAITDIITITSNDYLTLEQTQHNAKLVYNYLEFSGWSHNAICATLGNMQHESQINPGRYQNGVGPAYGLVQWDPSSKYLNWADKMGYADNSMIGQLNYLIHSMQPGNGEWFSNSSVKGYYLTSSKFISSTESVEFLTQVFLWSYERPSDIALENRISYAKYWDSYFS